MYENIVRGIFFYIIIMLTGYYRPISSDFE